MFSAALVRNYFMNRFSEKNIVFRRDVVAEQCNIQFLMLTKFLLISECRASSRFAEYIF